MIYIYIAKDSFGPCGALFKNVKYLVFHLLRRCVHSFVLMNLKPLKYKPESSGGIRIASQISQLTSMIGLDTPLSIATLLPMHQETV